MKITNWEKWQSFRKDRGTPPWIKLHRNLLSNEEWISLTDEEKGQLVSIWMLAADKSGSIPDNKKMVQRMAMLDSEPNINKFIELGFMSTTCQSLGCQVDTPEESRVEESRVEKDILVTSSMEDDEPEKVDKIIVPFKKIIDLYHEILPTLPRFEKLTDARRGNIRQRWIQDLPDLKNWENYFDYINQSAFLMGKVEPRDNRPPFTADLAWLIKPSNYSKVLEEKYHGVR